MGDKRMDRRHGIMLELGTGVIIGTAAGLLLPTKAGKDPRHFVPDRPTPVQPPEETEQAPVKWADRQAAMRKRVLGRLNFR